MSLFASPAMTPRPPKAATSNDMTSRAIAAGSVPPIAAKTADPFDRAGLYMPVALRRRLPRLATSSFLVAGDIASYLVAYFVVLSFFPSGLEGTLAERTFTIAAFAAIILYTSAGLYPGYRLHDHEHLRRRTVAGVKVAVLAAFGAIILPEGERLLLAVIGFLALGLIVQPFGHWLARGLCWKLGVWGERAVVIGGDDLTPALVGHFKNHWQYGIRPEAISLDSLEALPDGGPSIAVIAGAAGALADLAAMRRKFAEVILLSDTPSLKVSGLRPADVGGEIGIRLINSGSSVNSDLVRRILDLAIAIPASIVVAPFIAFAAAAIYAIDPGPVFFRHTREGRSGKPVHVLKLRTMYQDAEQRLEAVFRDDPNMRAEWLSHFKLKDDPRVIPVIGHMLRSSSIDELPQLANIIAGQMAIVGPRPFPEYHLSAMDSEFRDKRRSVTPGLTGLWQISERSNADIELQQQLDEFYIDNRSLWFDCQILLSTIPAVFKRRGAY
ncbi:exopolysaccharide biosynthesis UDP-galactose-lipid carrier transferase [Rhizobium leguminosarum bv. viciae]|uniref:Exopolysaccharide biosynthesis UDP-galactose-lipid carrier transferase n=1 Tax=Rhizobium leguminosarum bv. viciae TaxID=387 RepID=A0A4R0C409_RHILV|nr:sugar transferase [Rhizobium leguminosarum]MBY5793643.1 exopolysaccharide biosynthesis UDP-galactose-lipid carrier transferase [Rhizobium leguminosarum]NKM47724.1 exopolysaccharide biosynthesis UDP-galactose-lipid carrier transferase [Rhizobium leguminosarum bv. viciae]TBY76970.1 exopolysaccharide biosynthesis UDP-galactose-lipid carrier transferase [Rhizobium leguminosarum bv. viciae]TBZ10160.1 exopolysaccharide biosynthesis UDP-galactose-lipid carrier transferase [Rhizobium leguminosarum b